MVLDAERGQLVANEARRAVLLEAELRMRVQIAANAGEIVGPAADVFDRIAFHDAGPRSCPMRRGASIALDAMATALSRRRRCTPGVLASSVFV